MKEMKPTKTCKSLTIHIDDETLPEEFTEEELQAMSLEEICRLLYPRSITNEKLGCQTDNDLAHPTRNHKVEVQVQIQRNIQ